MDKQRKLAEKLKELEQQLIKQKWIPLLAKDFNNVKSPNCRLEVNVDAEKIVEIDARISVLSNASLCSFFHLFNGIEINHGGASHAIKCKLTLYQLISGFNNYDMPILSEPTLRRMFKNIWEDHSTIIDKWAEDWMMILSTPAIRALYASLNNPHPFKSVTMFIDGKDFVTILSDLSNEKKRTKRGKNSLISRKNSYKNAGKIVFLDDIKLNPICISEMVGANSAYDGHMMIKMNIHKRMDPSLDCLIFDHHFDSAVADVIEKDTTDGGSLQDCNFCFNIRKKKNIELLPDELEYQERHGGFRSKQETQRNASLVKTFARFSPHCSIRTKKFKTLQLQIKVACVLLALSNEEKRHPDMFADIDFKLENFEYPVEGDDSESSPSKSVNELKLLQNNMSLKQEEQFEMLMNGGEIESQNSNEEFETLPFLPVIEDTYFDAHLELVFLLLSF
jgi:hypothetical protein